jgi:uncharacterized protein DUF4953/uncharacterized protein DUF5117/uncharacterized protein DUF5118
MKALRFVVAVLACIAGAWPAAVRADDSDSGPVPYAKFVAGAQIQNGLFNVIRKSGKIYLEIAPSQLDQDFVQTAELGNGLGGYGILPGGISSSALIIRFSRSDDKVVVSWPNTFFIAPGNEPAQRAIKRTFANSTVAVAPVVATDAASGDIVIDASFFLNDIYNLTAALKAVTGADKPDQAYSLDSDRTLFGPTKAFPQNVIIDADQTWKSDNPQTIDNVPDPRTLLIRVVYNIAQPPNDPDFIPRLADDRVGYFDSPHLNFASDSSYTRIVRYAIRWNIQPSDPSKAVSPAKKPIVYYLSNEIPVQYRSTIRTAILRWNGAFEKIGILDAIVVRDQPDDPTWDPDDIRYNTVLWLTESDSGGFAAAAPVFDPRTGQAFRGNIVIDADWLTVLYGSGEYVSDPADRGLRPSAAGSEAELSRGMAREASFGLAAADIEGQPLTGQTMTKYVDDALLWTIMHESGHALGLMHNFIGTQAYGVKLMQDKTFTTNVGLSASVMDYVGINVWPKGERQGAYWQTVLGPYDYHAIRWGYAHIPGAKTPQQETATLDRWAAQWTNPMYRFASDEDAGYENARAIDPRVARWDLTSDPLTWSTGRLQLTDELMHKLDSRWPQPGHTYDQERAAFGWVWGERIQASTQPEHFMGGEYLSRSHAGDPGAQPPLTQVPRMQEARAFGVMDKYIFSDGAWNFSPTMLNRLVYSEWEPFINATWAYNPPPRHDLPVAEMAEAFAQGQLDIMFQPLMLERLDDLPLKAKPGSTMSLADLFDWTQASMYRDLSDRNLHTIPEVHRMLQQYYARLLVQLWLAPKDGTPYDAQSLARAKLVALRADLSVALGRQGLDELTRSHLQSMQEVVGRALDARQLVPAPPQAGS